jgi:RHS repeat-associated protein
MPHARQPTPHFASTPHPLTRPRVASGRTRLAGLLLALVGCLLAGAARTPAQNIQHTKNAPGNGMRSVFKVNPATNALELEVPLGPTGYPQRGGANVAPAVNYSSRIWRVGYSGPIYGYSQGGPPPLVGTRVVPRMAEDSRMGWTYSLAAPYVEKTAQDAMGGEVYDAWGNSVSTCTVGSGSACCFIDRLRVHMPGGGTHEFRSSDHPVCYNSSGGTPPLPDDLYSVDGSRMRLQRSTNRLYLPDGSYWVLSTGASSPAQYFDRNGNRLLNGFTDGLGRTFANPLDPALGADYTYTVPGVGGTPLTYTFRWRYLDQVLTVPLQPGQQLPNFSDDCGNSPCPEPNLFRSDTGASMPVITSGGSYKMNPLVLHQVVLPHDPSKPNPPTYTFTYNAYAEIDKVVYPTGGYERFAHGLVEHQQSGTFVYAQGNRGVTDRWVSARGDGSDEVRWRYLWTDAQGQPHRGEINPDGTRTERFTYYAEFGINFWSFTDARAGRPREEVVYNSAGQLVRRKLSEWANTGSGNCPSGGGAYSTCTATRNPRLTKEVEVIIEPGAHALAKTTVYGYDLSQQFTTGISQTSASEYDFVAVDLNTAQGGAITAFPAPALPLRKTETAYLDAANSAYRTRHILGLPTSVTVKDGAGTPKSQVTTDYDEAAYQLVNNYGAVSNWADPGALRGNPTTTGRWLDTAGGYVQTHATYDQVGNVVTSWDADGTQTQTAYSPAFSYAYPTGVTTAAPNPSSVPNPAGGYFGAGTFGSTNGFTVHTNYDPSTGLVISQTDANNRTTAYDYSDPLNRLKAVTRPDGGTTAYDYDRYNNAGRVSDYVATTTSLDAGRSVISFQYFDGLGRPDRSFLYEGGSPALYLTSDTQYDNLGRVWRVSNPHRTTGSDQPVNPPGLWTTTEYDALGRVRKVTTPDGARAQTEYDGLRVLATDQADKQRISRSDGLGRLVEVWEVKPVEQQNPDPWLESVSFPQRAGVPGVSTGYRTSYGYDVLGNLRAVSQPAGAQPGQTRTFAYDSLSRLTSATNPESGTVSYTYEPNGNLKTKTDARGVTANYTYDRLDRNIITHYSGGGTTTPAVYRYYDNPAAGKNGLGRLWWTYTGTGSDLTAAAVNAYDAVGRVLERRQSFVAGGAQYSVKLEYNLGGGVTRMTYPSGHAVTYNYDAAGRLGDSGAQPYQRAFTGTLGDGVERTYADQVTYGEFGGVRQERFGTQTPLYHKRRYNARGQLYNVRLSTGADADSWNRGMLVNHYGSADYANWGASGTNNNGNVLRGHHYVPNSDAADLNNGSTYTIFYQDYEYDALNRLTKVAESNSITWQQQYAQANKYDRWGNRTVDLGRSSNVPAALYDFERGDLPNTNRLHAPGDLAYANPDDPNRRMRYDAAGNLVHDAYTGAGGREYDAENRMTAAADRGGITAYYTYDSDGRRVKRKIANEEWWQVYGAGGELLAEYRAGAATYLPSKEYGYRGGELLVTMSSGDDQRLSRFVYNLYYGALRRDPTAQELQGRTNELAAAGAQGQPQLLQKAKEVARSLFTQTAYETSPYRAEAQYVADLYYTYLQRAPDDAGLAGWSGAAAGGVTNRSNVCDAFQESAEFSAVVSTLFGSATAEDERTERFVHRFHLAAYGRGATATEMQQWRDALNAAAAQGSEAVKAQAETLGRALFASQVGDLSLPAQQFVTNLYEGFLQRGPDAGGLSHWTGEAGATAQSRQNVLNAFASCDPFRELAGALYRETFWLVSDHLGTPRMVADRTGGLAGVRRHDYLPFGEELSAGTGGRTTVHGYKQPNTLRERWATYERDDETGLDYAQARYYSSALGRFTSPDEFSGGPDELFDFVDDAADNPTFYADLTNPQSLNKYQYTYNNPLNMVDPDGHCPDCPTMLTPPAGIGLLGQILNNPGKALDVTQTVISVIGVIPGAELADLANAAISTARGNYGEATLDTVGALGPVGSMVAVGNRARKLAKLASKTDEVADSVGFVRRAGPRNIEVRHSTRKQALEAAQHPHPGKKKPTPPKSDTKKRREYEEQQKYKKPERHRNSKHPEGHFHDRNKSKNKKVNRHHTFPD